MIALSRIQRTVGRRRRDTGEDVAGFYLVFFEIKAGYILTASLGLFDLLKKDKMTAGK